MASIYDFTLKTGLGEDFPLAQNKGKVMLIVNTATGCGFTPQYEPIEAMYEKYHDQGLEVIDIPCNQFMDQAPGTDEEITSFCRMRYKTQFPQMKKSDVNGENELPLYTFLKEQKGFEGFGLRGLRQRRHRSQDERAPEDPGQGLQEELQDQMELHEVRRRQRRPCRRPLRADRRHGRSREVCRFPAVSVLTH